MSPCTWVLSAAPHFSFCPPAWGIPWELCRERPSSCASAGRRDAHSPVALQTGSAGDGGCGLGGPRATLVDAALPTRCHRLVLAYQGLFPRTQKSQTALGGGGRGGWLPGLVRSWRWLGRGSLGTTGLLFALRPAVGGSRVVREGGCRGPRRGCLCRCSCGRGVSCFVLGTDRLLALS